MLSLLVCLAATHQTPGLDTLRHDLEQAWSSNQPNYHRFLSAAYGLTKKSMEDQEVRKVYRSLHQQGVLFDPLVETQHDIRSEPLFTVKIGGLEHKVVLEWITQEVPAPSEPKRHKVVGAEVELVAKSHVRFDEFVKSSPYPSGTVLDLIIHRDDLHKGAATFPYLESVTVSYVRSGPPLSGDDQEGTGYPCQYRVIVALASGVTDLATVRNSWFYVTSGLDRPLTYEGNPLPGPFESKDSLGRVDARINSGGYGRLSEDSVGFLRIGSPPHYSQDDDSCSAYTAEDLEFLPVSVESLFMNGHDFGVHGHELLARLKGLKYLTIWNVDLTSKQLAVVASLPNLEELEIASDAVDDELLKSLATAKNLRSLSISSSTISNKGIASLAQLPNLNKLELNRCDKLGPDFAKELAKFPSLTKLKFAAESAPAAVITNIARLTCLEELTLCGFGKVAPESFRPISALKSLKSLSIEVSSVDDRFLKQIPLTWPHIRSLHFEYDPNITDQGAVSLGNLKQLDWLCFYICKRVTKVSSDRLTKLLGTGFEH